MASLFESYERRIDKINAVLAQYGINGVEDAKAICAEKGLPFAAEAIRLEGRGILVAEFYG